MEFTFLFKRMSIIKKSTLHYSIFLLSNNPLISSLSMKGENSFHEKMQAYQNLLQQGDLQDAYQGLMAYLRELRVHFYNKFPDLKVAGSIYPGNMDYSFFP